MQTQRSWFFYLCALEGAAAIAALFLIPSEGGRLSLARLALIGLITAICIGWIYVGLRRPHILDHAIKPVYLFPCVLLTLLLGLLLFLLRYLHPEALSTYVRLSPLLWYLLVLSIQLFFYLLFLSNGFRPEALEASRLVIPAALIAFGLLLLLVLVIAITRLGLTPDPAYWGEPGVAILGWGFLLALLGGVLCFVVDLFGAREFPP